MPDGADSRASVHADADVALFAFDRRRAVDSHPHAQLAAVGPIVRCMVRAGCRRPRAASAAHRGMPRRTSPPACPPPSHRQRQRTCGPALGIRRARRHTAPSRDHAAAGVEPSMSEKRSVTVPLGRSVMGASVAHRVGRDRYPAPVAGIPLDRVPNSPRTAWLALRDELHHILGDELVAMWAYGGTMAVDDPAHTGDLDTYVVPCRPDEATTGAIEAAQHTIASSHGVEWDAWYVLADAARRADPPHHALARRAARHRMGSQSGALARRAIREPSTAPDRPIWSGLRRGRSWRPTSTGSSSTWSATSWRATPIRTRRRTRC